VTGGGESSVGIGDVLGDFRILRELGAGGMGVVFLAQDDRLERRVALKVISPHLARNEDFRQRFNAEARSAAAIDNPNAVTVYSSGTADGNLYIAMRYVEGTDLRTALREKGPLEASVAIGIVSEVAAALDAAHAAGMVHRDVKPGNILLEGEIGEGISYLTDFGLTKGGSESGAQLTGTGQWVGTIDYVAPEQIQAGKIDARTDVYALGCVLYEALTGTVPFVGNDMQKMWGHVNEPFPELQGGKTGGEGGVGAVVERATAKDPGDRFPSAGDLARAASAALAGAKVEAPEQSVATGAAAKGLGEEAPTRKLPDPDQAPTVTGRSPLPPPRRPAARSTPPPPPPRQPSSPGGGSSATRTAAIIGGAVVVAAGLLAAAVVIAGKDTSSGQTTNSAAGRQVTKTHPNTSTPKPPQPQMPAESELTQCSASVSVGAVTSCPFGINVARAYRASGGSSSVRAYSPVTEIEYMMNCAGTAPVVCTGGKGASVYIGN
jgi:serine/threonine protein kinase